MGTHQRKVNNSSKTVLFNEIKSMGDRSFSEFFQKLALRMDGLFILKKEVVMEMEGKKQNQNP